MLGVYDALASTVWDKLLIGDKVFPGIVEFSDLIVTGDLTVLGTRTLLNTQTLGIDDPMIHLGKNTKSKIISKGISAGNADNMYRGLVDIKDNATNSRNYTQCDSLLMGNKCGAHTIPYIKNSNATSTIEHEATTTKINEEQLYYCNQRGLDQEEAVSLIVNGFCKEVLQQLPMEFAVEAQKLVAISLEGSVG